MRGRNCHWFGEMFMRALGTHAQLRAHLRIERCVAWRAFEAQGLCLSGSLTFPPLLSPDSLLCLFSAWWRRDTHCAAHRLVEFDRLLWFQKFRLRHIYGK